MPATIDITFSPPAIQNGSPSSVAIRRASSPAGTATSQAARNDRHDPLEREHPRQEAQPSLAAQSVDGRREERHADVEGADDERGRAEVARGLGVEGPARRDVVQSREDLGGVPARVGVGVDGKDAGVRVARVAEATRRVDEELARVRSRVGPPGAGHRPPDQAQVQVALAGRPRALGGFDDPGGSLHVAQLCRADQLLDQQCAGRLDRSAVVADLAEQRCRQLGRAELHGELGRRQETPPAVRRIAELGGPAQRGERHVHGATPARAPRGLLEVDRDGLLGRR